VRKGKLAFGKEGKEPRTLRLAEVSVHREGLGQGMQLPSSKKTIQSSRMTGNKKEMRRNEKEGSKTPYCQPVRAQQKKGKNHRGKERRMGTEEPWGKGVLFQEKEGHGRGTERGGLGL